MIRLEKYIQERKLLSRLKRIYKSDDHHHGPGCSAAPNDGKMEQTHIALHDRGRRS
jgi:hypothetical protein